VMLEDGGILVAEFNEVIPATPITFDKTQDDVTARLMQELLTKALRDYGQTLVEKVKNGSNLSQFGITQTVTQQTRDATLANTPREVLTKAFLLGEKGVALVEAGDYVGLVQLMSIDKADLNGPDALASQQALAAQLEQSMVQDVFGLMTEDLSKSAGISLNNTAINAVHAQVQ
jgi:peptidyl-prolyl cis-trans isomerase D